MLGDSSSSEAETAECRLFVDPPLPGPWNMAVDELLLDWSAETHGCAWRFYQWEEPTLSLGYFQPLEDRGQHAASRGCPVVRRLTGGGAILHDDELTYSVVVPAGHPLAGARDRLYRAVHGSLIDVLAAWQMAAEMARPAPVAAGAEEPFLCFARRAPGDVVIGGVKIAGSAQRRRRGAVLQHGSVLLRGSAAAPEIHTPEPLRAAALSAGRLVEAWLPVLSGRLRFRFRRQELSAAERRRAEALARGRYAQADWTAGRRRAVVPAANAPRCL